MNFKIGDKVRVKDNLDKITGFRGGYMKEMDDLIGKIVTIDEIDGNEILLKEDPHGYVWDERAFKPAVMTKQDLKDGDIVTLRNGDKLIYFEYDGTFADLHDHQDNGICSLDNLTDNMKYGGHIYGQENDIIEVKRPVAYDNVFTRDETVKEMTLKEVCDALGYEVKIVKEEE